MLVFLLGLLFLNLNVTFSFPQSSFSSSIPRLCSYEEASALLQLKTSFPIDKNSKIESWKEAIDCCSWDGISCDNSTGHVIGLDLSSSLSGSFPSNNSLFLLKNLQSLNLAYNDFMGSKIPPEIGRFPSLKFLVTVLIVVLLWQPQTNCYKIPHSLFLPNNNIDGQIPPSLLELTHLTYLVLSSNQLSGPIPAIHPSKLSKLSFLLLDNNLLNGTIPLWMFTHPQLRSLSVSKNLLEGQVSQFQQNSLEALDFSYNRLHGSVPSSISNQVNLYTLDLSSNNLSGILEFDMLSNLQSLAYLNLSNTGLTCRNAINSNFSLPGLEYLDLSLCGLSNFPNFIRESVALAHLKLSNNKIEGRIPKWMWDVGNDSLQYLSLSNNSLTGAFEQIPWKNIFFLDLGSNKFQQVLPVPPNGIRLFSVSNNCFNGGITSEICNVETFEVLDLSHNNFSGMMPICLHNSSKNLRVLNLQANKFSGNIPSMFSKECALNNLNLQGNRIEGPLPRSIVNCGKLGVLDVGNNNIRDAFPSWLESLTELQVLILRSNKFHGFVIGNVKTNSSFPKLRILDLCNNEFSGPLPVRYIENLKAMMETHEDGNSSLYMEDEGVAAYKYRFSIVVTMKGSTIDLENILTILTSIDLSKNKFVGEIPNAIGKLSSLKGLNLSHNNLDGHIPPVIGNLTNLEWLDLSSNELVGKIPEQLVSLIQLGTLQLSNNQLVGRIPQGNQFNTFGNDSYQGNVGLCGPPISKTCGGSGTQIQQPASSQENDEFWVFSWKIVALGYGSGTVFGLLLGCLMFYIGKPRWFVSLIDIIPYLRRRKMDKAIRLYQRRNGLQT